MNGRTVFFVTVAAVLLFLIAYAASRRAGLSDGLREFAGTLMTVDDEYPLVRR